MSWHLFLDDERSPARDGLTIARSFSEAVTLVKEKGLPEFMTLDHDLGDSSPTGYDFVLWLTNYVIDQNLQFPPYFTFYVHSQNPVGAENMRCLLDNFILFRNGELYGEQSVENIDPTADPAHHRDGE
jgi:hypothetical protein